MFQNGPGPFTRCTLMVEENYPSVLMCGAGKTKHLRGQFIVSEQKKRLKGLQ